MSKKRKDEKRCLFFGFVFLPVAAFAQTDDVLVVADPGFLTALFAGIIIAFGLFSIATAALAMSAITSMVGSLIQLVRAGLHTVTDAARSILQRSDEHREGDIAEELTETILGETEIESDHRRVSRGHEKPTDAGMSVVGLTHEQAEQQRKPVEEYLANTGKSELDPQGIKRDLERIVTGDSNEGVEAIRERLRPVDGSSVTAILPQRKDLSEDEARRLVHRVADAVESLRSQFGEARGALEGSMRDYGEG